MNKAAIATLGCKVNQAESFSIIQQLQIRGYDIVNFNDVADVYIINTCTVTKRTDLKSRSLIRKALYKKELNREIKVFVTGCYAQKETDEIRALGDIDLIIDNFQKIDLNRWFNNEEFVFIDIMSVDTLLWKNITAMHDRTRAYLKIQDGCSYDCAYCAVPLGRGRPRCLTTGQVLEQATVLINNGYKELIVTGINLGLYKDPIDGSGLPQLIRYLASLDSDVLLRLSSVEPDLWTDELLDAIDCYVNICPHFHIPVQSGSDNVLIKMQRRYDIKLVNDLINALSAVKPNCAIGLDIICGFPGETDEDHQATYDLINGLPIAYLHVFGFSRRASTTAGTMPNQIDKQIKIDRVRSISYLSRRKKNYYTEMLIDKGELLRGVVEKVDDKVAISLSDHYVRLYHKSIDPAVNQIICGRALKRFRSGILI